MIRWCNVAALLLVVSRTALAEEPCEREQNLLTIAETSLRDPYYQQPHLIAGVQSEVYRAKAALHSCLADVEKERAQRHERALEQLKRQSDPVLMGPAYSAALCGYQAFEKDALEQLRENQRNARIAGVINVTERYEIQQQIASYRAAEKEIRQDARQLRAKLLPCSTRLVQEIVTCKALMAQGQNCSDGKAAEYVDVTPVVVP